MERPGFFEALGIADQERVHTQFLAWLVSERTTPLTPMQRAQFVCDLLDFRGGDGNWAPSAVMTEFKCIDLVIVAGADLIILENKVKSRLGVDQLKRYNLTVKMLGKKASGMELLQNVVHTHKLFLTLSGEVNANGWKDVDYRQIKVALDRLQTDDVFVRSYQSYLNKLLNFRDEYLANHVLYPQVELNAGLDSLARLAESKRADLSPLTRFVLESRLDTIFAEALLWKLANQAEAPGQHVVSETRGHALLETTLYEFRLLTSKSERPFRAGAQLQRDTFKLNLGAGEEYRKSTRDWIADLETTLDAEVMQAWDSRLGVVVPAAAKSRAYRSWILRKGTNGRLSTTPLEEYVPLHKARVLAAEIAWKAVLVNLQAMGLVTDIVPVQRRVQTLQTSEAKAH